MRKSLAMLISAAYVSYIPFCFSGTPYNDGGFSNVTGGDSYPAVTVKNISQLLTAVSEGRHHIIVSGHIYGGHRLTTLNFDSTKNNNTTIEGEPGGKAELENIQIKFDGENLNPGMNINNVKIANISFYGRVSDLQQLPKQSFLSHDIDKKTGINYEGVSLRRVNNALITHCTIYDTSDDLMSVTLSSDNVTISYNHLYFTDGWVDMQPSPIWNWVGTDNYLSGERLAMVIGANAKDSWRATGKLHVTLHDNWIGPNMRGRPLFRGWIHLYNNYFDNKDDHFNGNIDKRKYNESQYEAFQVNSGSVVYSESNYFISTNNTNTISKDDSGYDFNFFERQNTYIKTTGKSAKGSPFESVPVRYTYHIIDSRAVPAYVMSNAGPK